MHREAADSAGLHLFQELSTLGQQLASAPLLGSGLGRIKPVFPTGTPRSRQPCGARSRSRPPCIGIFHYPDRCAWCFELSFISTHSHIFCLKK
jgi:hypothetical protein